VARNWTLGQLYDYAKKKGADQFVRHLDTTQSYDLGSLVGW
jgi:hypothetical protein